ncbi:hypothetical protein TcasGA2_TC011414 [Tribolium castaneum]|uniref:Uncharacterized protein n=1 Tax=Tribolium castaneum TaxID=7070 RepID=D6X4I0_TRICA|nr:hypothetical protein TcasGA2_TC011414 [Tribolium castaneum]
MVFKDSVGARIVPVVSLTRIPVYPNLNRTLHKGWRPAKHTHTEHWHDGRRWYGGLTATLAGRPRASAAKPWYGYVTQVPRRGQSCLDNRGKACVGDDIVTCGGGSREGKAMGGMMGQVMGGKVPQA